MEIYFASGPNTTMIAINVNNWYWENKNNYLWQHYGVFYKKMEYRSWDILVNYKKGINFHEAISFLCLSSYFSDTAPELMIFNLLNYKSIVNLYKFFILVNNNEHIDSKIFFQNLIDIERKKGVVFEFKNSPDVFYVKTAPIKSFLKKNNIDFSKIDMSFLKIKKV